MKQYAGEDWYLQLDSHHRFAPGWDSMLIEQAVICGSAKPLLTTYAAAFAPADEAQAVEQVTTMEFDQFNMDGLPTFKGALLTEPAAQPVRARFVSAHFLFAPGDFVQEVPYDPELYFVGEEISLAVRAFTHGYDLFHPARHILWHDYTRTGRTKHWDDHTGEHGATTAWHERDKVSVAKVLRLLIDPWVGPDGLGTVRDAGEYENYAGISFRHRRVQAGWVAAQRDRRTALGDSRGLETSLLFL
jgi:hypothetical protein